MEIELQSLNPVSPPGPSKRLASTEHYSHPESQNLLNDSSQNQNDSGNCSDLQEIVTETPDPSDHQNTIPENPQEKWIDALYKAVADDNVRDIVDLMEVSNELQEFAKSLVPYFFDKKEDSPTIIDKPTITDDFNIEFSIHGTDMFGFVCEEKPVDASWSMLHLASSYAKLDTVRLLMRAGANPHSLDSLGRTVLDVCGCNLHEKLQNWDHDQLGDTQQWERVIPILLEAGVNFSVHNYIRKDHMFYTLLLTGMVKAKRKNLGLIRQLLEAGAFMDTCEYTVWPSIETIVHSKGKEELQIILDYYNGGVLANITLEKSAKLKWVDGARMALLMGASLVEKDFPINQTTIHQYHNMGKKYPLHIAAARGNLDVFKTMIAVAKFKTSGQDNYKQLCEFFPDAPKSTESQVKYFSKLCSYTETFNEILDLFDGFHKRAIYYAVNHNRVECFKILLEHKASVLCYAHTLLHLAAKQNCIEIAKMLIEHNDKLVNGSDMNDTCPLHIACTYGHKEMISILLQKRADLSREDKFGMTPLRIITEKFANPHAFLKTMLDSYVRCMYNSDANTNFFEVDIRILTPKDNDNEYDVVETLIAEKHTDIFTHPVIESFIYLEWNTLVYLYILALVFRVLFVSALILYISPLYYYHDKKKPMPTFFNSTFWLSVIYFASIYYVYENVMKIKRKCQVQLPWYKNLRAIWFKIAAVILHICLPLALYWDEAASTDFCRYAASGVVLCSFIEAMFLVSIVFDWGFYVLVFRKIVLSIMKLLLLPGMMVLVFGIVFMIQFRAEEPFDGIVNAFMKVFAMGTMELDYSSTYNATNYEDVNFGNMLQRGTLIVFVALVALASFGLVNSFAIADIDDLERTGKVKTLKKQATFLASLEKCVCQRYLKKKLLLIAPYWKTENGVEAISDNNGIYEVTYSVSPFLPKHIKESVVEIVKARIEDLGEEGAKNERLSINAGANAFSTFNVLMEGKRTVVIAPPKKL